MEKKNINQLKSKQKQNGEAFNRFRSKLKTLSKNTIRSLSIPRSQSSSKTRGRTKRKNSDQIKNHSNASSRSVSPNSHRTIFSKMTQSNMSDSSHENIELNSIHNFQTGLHNDSENDFSIKKLNIDELKTPVPSDQNSVRMRFKPFSSSSQNSPEYFTCRTSLMSPGGYSLYLGGVDQVSCRDSLSSVTSITSITSLVSQLSYEFTTLDRHSISAYGIEVTPINQRGTVAVITDSERSSPQTHLRPVDVDSEEALRQPCWMYNDAACGLSCVHWTSDQLEQRSSVFNSNNFGLVSEMRCRDQGLQYLLGTVRVYINLLRPVQMEFSPRPSSIFDVLGYNLPSISTAIHPDEQQHQDEFSKIETFWLPRGTSKRLFVTQCTTAVQVINGLLTKFRIRGSPKKFGLYDHTIEGDLKVAVRKLPEEECPLATMLSWAEEGPSVLNETMAIRRLVLQENETGDIEWNGFLRPELENFLRILDREEHEARSKVTLKYGVLKAEIVRLRDLKVSQTVA